MNSSRQTRQIANRIEVWDSPPGWSVQHPPNVLLGETAPQRAYYVGPDNLRDGWRIDAGERVELTPDVVDAIHRWQAEHAKQADGSVLATIDPDQLVIEADEDTEPLDWPGYWHPGEEDRIWQPTGAGEYLLLAGLPGTGKSHFAQELAARERESGGRPLAIVPEAVASWRTRNWQLPANAKTDLIPGVPPAEMILQALTARAAKGRKWPTMVIVDPLTLATAEWGHARRDQGTYDYPTVRRAVAALAAAVTNPDTGKMPPLIVTVHTPETEQGGRGKRAVGGYTQGAGAAYILPSLGIVKMLKPPRDCPTTPTTKPMVYTRTEHGRITFGGLGTGTGENRNPRDRTSDRRRIIDYLGEAGPFGITEKDVVSDQGKMKGIGRKTFGSVIEELVGEGYAMFVDEPGLAGGTVRRYFTTQDDA